ncbi:MAG: prepilin-type N-terminal cleavage/methylation domain-containing protein [Candidatus Sumerlaeia bacterium]|nr:prepilin-type N-terminal cleavage/methylation domain-containing protein [Candidatus Sumerlaeia bacterium]
MTRRAFTLVELLITVAVVAILAAIALPNFLEAQTRAKVGAAISNLRTVGNALHAYRVDNSDWPPTEPVLPHDPLAILADFQLAPLTTPVAYLGRGSFGDPFGVARIYTAAGGGPATGFFPPNPNEALLYQNFRSTAARRFGEPRGPVGWGLVSIGPDIEDSLGAYCRLDPREFRLWFPYSVGLGPVDTLYDPTNGTTSPGDIVRLDSGPGR